MGIFWGDYGTFIVTAQQLSALTCDYISIIIHCKFMFSIILKIPSLSRSPEVEIAFVGFPE